MIGNEYFLLKTPSAIRDEIEIHDSPTDAHNWPAWKSATQIDSVKKETGNYCTK